MSPSLTSSPVRSQTASRSPALSGRRASALASRSRASCQASWSSSPTSSVASLTATSHQPNGAMSPTTGIPAAMSVANSGSGDCTSSCSTASIAMLGRCTMPSTCCGSTASMRALTGASSLAARRIPLMASTRGCSRLRLSACSWVICAITTSTSSGKSCPCSAAGCTAPAACRMCSGGSTTSSDTSAGTAFGDGKTADCEPSLRALVPARHALAFAIPAAGTRHLASACVARLTALQSRIPFTATLVASRSIGRASGACIVGYALPQRGNHHYENDGD